MVSVGTMAIKILFLIGLLALVHKNINGQQLDSRFIVYIDHFPHPFLNETVSKCVGTLITQLHILTTASCVTVQAPTQIAVNASMSDAEIFSSLVVPANRVIIHPFYDNNQFLNNAALVITTMFASNPQLGFVPRRLGNLDPLTSLFCNLFGWGGELINPRRDQVIIEDPTSCGVNNPTNLCSVFSTVYHDTCSALHGSPLTCGYDTVVSGFVTNEAGCITTPFFQTLLFYHSVGDFQDWIDGVIGPELPEREAVNFIVTVMERDIFAVPRCFGTIISSNRVLTTALCATIDSIFNLEVQTRIVQGSTSRSTNIRASRVNIHPAYRRDNQFANNVAVIEINGSFDERIIPRTLGSFELNNQCQLFGWGPTDIEFTRGDAITVNSPQECNVTHPQPFCSSHPTTFHYSCNAMTGSPVTCGDNESVIAGFLINNATCSSGNNNRVTLSYHSVSQFRDWILNPTNDGVSLKISTVFILFVAVIGSLMN